MASQVSPSEPAIRQPLRLGPSFGKSVKLIGPAKDLFDGEFNHRM